MANGVSTLALQIASIRQARTLQTKMAGYQEQVATGVKHQTFAGYGADASRIQEYRSGLTSVNTYLYNIEIAQAQIEQMDAALSETTKQAGNVLSAISIQLTQGSGFDLEAIKNAASTALQIVQANMNVQNGDKYLFAGTDVNNKPYDGAVTATSSVQSQISDWLDGTTTDTTAFLDGLDAMTDSQLGYSAGLQTSKDIFVRASDDLEVNYTVKANDSGYRKIITGLNALANLEKPATGDIPTEDDFYTALNSLYQMVQSGVEDLRAASVTVSSASQVIDTLKQSHLNDKQNYQKTLEATEATDVTDSIVKFQTLQTQLESSYQITAILSQMSLARILG